MQSHMAFTALASSPCTFGPNAKCNCVSSALEVTLGKCRRTISNSSLVYSVNTSGPRRDPYGTSCASGKVFDSRPLTALIIIIIIIIITYSIGKQGMDTFLSNVITVVGNQIKIILGFSLYENERSAAGRLFYNNWFLHQVR